MFKAGKSTHLTIIATFAIVFIVIYLYYTITDLRKLQIEVGKINKQMADLKIAVSSAAQTCPMPTMPMPTMTFEPMMPVDNVAVPDDDNNSVNTEEIKNILDRQDSEKLEDEPDVPEPASTQANVEPEPEPTVVPEQTGTKTVNIKAKKTKASAK